MTRLVLTANTDFYVSTTGSDSNDGLSTSTAWRTVSHGAYYIKNNVDAAGFIATLNVGAGTYSENVAVVGAMMGGVQFFIKGDETTPGNVIIGTGGNAPGIYARDLGIVTISGVRVLGGVQATQLGVIDIGKPGSSTPTVEFGQATGGVHINAGDSGFINIIGPYSIVDNAYYHINCSTLGRVNLGGQQCTIPSARAFYAFVNTNFRGTAVCNTGETYVGSGVSGTTGLQYSVAQQGALVKNGITFPGSGSYNDGTGFVFG